MTDLCEVLKSYLKKDLRQARLNYKEIKTVAFEIEIAINNRSLTYIYLTNLEAFLTSNHILFGYMNRVSDHNASLMYACKSL